MHISRQQKAPFLVALLFAAGDAKRVCRAWHFSSTALRLSKFFGVSPDFWLNMQLRWDIYFAQQSEANILKTIKPISPKHEYAH
jgi:hypothetical protein